MQEIEIKFRIDNREQLLSKLESLHSHFSEPVKQKDIIFVPDLNDTANGEGKIFIRIRRQNEKKIITLKKQSKVIMQNKEIEFGISDIDKAYDFLETIGFKEWVTVEKTRIETTYQEFNLCIDQVKRLGDFVEIEILSEEENQTEFYEKKILEIAKELGIPIKNRVDNYYDSMIAELNEKENLK